MSEGTRPELGATNPGAVDQSSVAQSPVAQGVADGSAAEGSAAVRMDPRTARVRAQLLRAAKELARSGKPVSVSALVRHAEVSRSVFYVHFTEIEAVALTERGTDRVQSMRDAQVRIVTHVSENRELYRLAMAMSSQAATMQGCADANAEAIESHFAHTGVVPAHMDGAFAARYVANAVAGTLTEWISGDIELSGERLAAHLFDMLPPWFYGPGTSAD